MALTAKNKLKFIDGTIKKPSAEIEDEFYAWNCSNNMVLSWILNFVSKDIAASVIYINSTDDMWNDLKDCFLQKNGPRIFQLQKCSCDNPKILADHSHQDYIFQFLMGLNDSFAQIRGGKEERQREIYIHLVQVETAALMTRASSQYQNQQHHNSKSSFRKDRPLCIHCGLLGHTMEKCYKLHGYPPGYKFNKNKPNTISANEVQEVDQPLQIPQLSISQEQIQQLLSLFKPSTSVPENSPSALQSR
ncbi:uncharacterized protein LOC133869196 [Alnus glutinosa]|uniref:uncharacterized protein LOC133869196 n=1 Tax=Alnus glutinosa TaxID=3517 RepID=UPI002D77F90C|nr:uncharacterized protein LOC133869196 [Alnus glutinosa]